MGPWSKIFLFFVRSVLTKKSVFRPNWRKSEGPKWPKRGSPKLELFSPIFNKSPSLTILVNFGQNGGGLKNFPIFRDSGHVENIQFQVKFKKIWGAKMTKNGDPKFGTFSPIFKKSPFLPILVNFGQNGGGLKNFRNISWLRTCRKYSISGQI